MSEKLSFSPYPPQARVHQSPPVRRSRRRLLPYLFIGILALIYLSHSTSTISQNASPKDTPEESVIREPVAELTPVVEATTATMTLGLLDIPPETPAITHDRSPLEDPEPRATTTSSYSEPMPSILTEEEVKNGAASPPDPQAKSNQGNELKEDESTEGSISPGGTSKVALEAHIMSKCPDAQACLRLLVVPAMEQVSDLVDFNLSFVQTVQSDGSVKCKHGPGECLGDQLILCAQKIYPDSPVRSLGFANCLINDYQHIPERAHVENCALEHGVSFEKLNECASDSGQGPELLKESAEWTKSEGVRYSCTVRVNREKYCVRDGGQWKECEDGSEVKDLVSRIRELSDKN